MSAATSVSRQYKRLNLGGNSSSAGGAGVASGVSISTFRKGAGKVKPALEPGHGCGAAGGKDPNLEF